MDEKFEKIIELQDVLLGGLKLCCAIEVMFVLDLLLVSMHFFAWRIGDLLCYL